MAEFRMPSLGADMEQGTLVEWRVRPGDRVARGDIVALVETEKGLIEVEIFASGVVESILVEPGATVPVGTVLAMVRGEAELPAPEAPGVAPPGAAEPSPPAAGASPRPPIGEPSTPAPHVRVSPLARRTAAELHVDLATVRGTGDAGTITKADVERALAERGAVPVAPTPVPGPPDRLASMRKVIASAMARSKREIPHYYLATQIDMSRAVSWLAAENAQRPVTARLLHAVLLLRAVALAVHEVPELNGFWLDGQFHPGAGVHVGVAISLRQGGLVAPAIHDVDRKPLEQLMHELLDLVKRTRAGVLRSSEVSDATMTVTNLGDQGVETVFGVIYPPQVALVGFGRLVDRPWVAEGSLAVRSILTATLSADHRASDGHRGGRFLAAIEQLLQKPETL
jgi:pyruvate dehydrogenase E2 component (dihydrolipoyllysine-residue acetyltransferase)